MAQEVRFRKQKTINYSSGNEVAEELGRGMVYRELYLRLRGQLTLTAANNTAAKTLRGDEWACIQYLEVIANNTEVIWRVTGNELWWINFFFFGTKPHVTSAIGDGATANPSFDSCLVLPFWMFRSVFPIETALDARRLSDLKIRVKWGAFTSINGDATAWTTEPTLEINSLEATGPDGDFATAKYYTTEQQITADSTQFQVKLPVGHVYRGFLISTTNDGKDASGILNNLKVISGSTIFADTSSTIIKQIHGRQRVGIEYSFDAASGAYDAFRRGTTYNSAGAWHFFDMVTEGRLVEANDTLGYSEFSLELDVTKSAGVCKLHIVPLTIIPVRK